MNSDGIPNMVAILTNSPAQLYDVLDGKTNIKDIGTQVPVNLVDHGDNVLSTSALLMHDQNGWVPILLESEPRPHLVATNQTGIWQVGDYDEETNNLYMLYRPIEPTDIDLLNG